MPLNRVTLNRTVALPPKKRGATAGRMQLQRTRTPEHLEKELEQLQPTPAEWDAIHAAVARYGKRTKPSVIDVLDEQLGVGRRAGFESVVNLIAIIGSDYLLEDQSGRALPEPVTILSIVGTLVVSLSVIVTSSNAGWLQGVLAVGAFGMTWLNAWKLWGQE